MNPHFYVRQGVSFKEMSEAQREAAIELLRASLSAKGLQQSQDIMRLNHTLGELNNDFEQYGEGKYWITVMGEPSATEPWGWQLDGHHLVINYFVLGDQVVMTPDLHGFGAREGDERQVQRNGSAPARAEQGAGPDQRPGCVPAQASRSSRPPRPGPIIWPRLSRTISCWTMLGCARRS